MSQAPTNQDLQDLNALLDRYNMERHGLDRRYYALARVMEDYRRLQEENRVLRDRVTALEGGPHV